MTMFVIQSLLLLAIGFVLGCIAGALARHYIANIAEHETGERTEVSTYPSPPKIDEESRKDNEVVIKPLPPEPVVEPEPDATLMAEPEAQPDSGQTVEKDNLKRIKGIGPQNEARLNSIGVTTFSQIAAWSMDEQQQIGERLAFPGRIEREKWVEQAKKLSGKEHSEETPKPESSEVNPAPEPKNFPEAESQSKPMLFSSPPADGADNLTRIEGVGNALEKKLNNLGVYTFKQISEWSAQHQAWIGDEIGFPGRPERENWIKEAKELIEAGLIDDSRILERGEITTTRKARL